MLIETPYKVGDTVSFKLTSGEEIVARLEAEEPGVYTLKRPMTMVAQQSGLGLAPLCLVYHLMVNLCYNQMQLVVLQKLKKR